MRKLFTQFWEVWKIFIREKKGKRVECLDNSAWEDRGVGLSSAFLCDM